MTEQTEIRTLEDAFDQVEDIIMSHADNWEGLAEAIATARSKVIGMKCPIFHCPLTDAYDAVIEEIEERKTTQDTPSQLTQEVQKSKESRHLRGFIFIDIGELPEILDAFGKLFRDDNDSGDDA